MFKVTAAAKYLDISTDTLRRWEEDGKLIPTKRTPSGYRLYSKTLLKNLKNEAQTLGKSHISGKKLLSKNQKLAVGVVVEAEEDLRQVKWAFLRSEKFFKHNSLVFWVLTTLVLVQFIRLLMLSKVLPRTGN